MKGPRVAADKFNAALREWCRFCADAAGWLGLSREDPPATKPRRRCPHCGRTYSVNQDGTLRRHDLMGQPRYRKCPGSYSRIGEDE